MARPKQTDEQKLAKLAAKQSLIILTPAHKFFESCKEGGVYVPGQHNCGHFVGIQKLKSGNTESGEDAAVVIFEVMESRVDGTLLRKPRYTTSQGKYRQVVYPQMTIEWGQVDGVARAMLKLFGGEKGGAIKEEVLSSDKVVVEERAAAIEGDEMAQLSRLYDT